MRRDTTIAIGVAVLLIVLGTSYLVWGNRGGSANKPGDTTKNNTTGATTASQDKNGQSVLTGAGAAARPSAGGAPTLARHPDSTPPTPRAGGSDVSSSPLSPTVRDTTPTTPRPRPFEPAAPGTTLTGTYGTSPTGTPGTGLTGPGSVSATPSGTVSFGSSGVDPTRSSAGVGSTSSSLGGSSNSTPGPMPRANTLTTPAVGVLPATPGLSSPSTRPALGSTSPTRVGTVDALATTTGTPDRSTPSLAGSTAGPVDLTRKTTAATTGKVTTHVIQSGDTYSSLAVKYLGHSKYANLIAKANPNVDPRRLRLGAKLNIPPVPEAAISSAFTESKEAARSTTTSVKPLTATTTKRIADPIPADRSYKVTANDSWSSLAKQCFGDSSRWIELYELNKERVPRDRSFALPIGTIIELPAGARITKPAEDKATAKPS